MAIHTPGQLGSGTPGATNFLCGDGTGQVPVAGYADDNVSDPPSYSEIVTAFGAPDDVGAGFVGILDDAGAGTDVYLCFTTGVENEWFYVKGTLAQDPM